MDPQLQEILKALLAIVTEAKGLGVAPWLGVVSVVAGVIRLWRTDAAQGSIVVLVARWPFFRFLVWDGLPLWAKFTVPFLGAALAGVVAVMTGATSWLLALTGALGVGFAAILGHHGTKAIGSAITPLTVKLPTPARHAASLVLPIDPSRIPKLP